MYTERNLDQVYEKAEAISFNKNSRFVFFSDLHRGDNSLSDDFARNRNIYFHALEYYNKSDFTYIEVGDGDELLEHSKFQHIYSAHSDVFNLLKSFHDNNRMIMLYGNHNMFLKYPHYVEKHYYSVFDESIDETIPLFTNLKTYESIILVHETSGQRIFVIHGHQGDFLNHQAWRVSLFIIRYFWRFMHILGVNYAASPAKNRDKRHKIEKKYTKWNRQHNIMLICGHTHRAKFPLNNESSFFNIGCGMHPRGINCIEIVDDKIILVKWHMHTRNDGLLFIKRTVMRGPVPISEFSHVSPEFVEGEE